MPDTAFSDIAAYAARPLELADGVRGHAALVLRAALAALLVALRTPQGAQLIGPVVPGATMPGGARVPGTSLELDPIQAAFSIAALVGGSGDPTIHVSALLPVADWLARRARLEGREPPLMGAILSLLVKCCEIEGAVGREAGGVRLAATAVVAALLGATADATAAAARQAWSEAAPVHGRWAEADELSRGVQLGFAAVRFGFPDALAAPARRPPPRLGHALGCRVMQRLPIDGPAIEGRFEAAVAARFGGRRAEAIGAHFAASGRLEQLPVNEFMATLVVN